MTDYKITPLCQSICFQARSRELAGHRMLGNKIPIGFLPKVLWQVSCCWHHPTAHMSEPVCLTSASALAKLSSESQPVPQATISSQEELKLIGNPSLVLMKRKRQQNTWNPGVFCFGLSPIFLPIPLLNFHYFPNFSTHSLSHGHMPSYKSYLERRAAS